MLCYFFGCVLLLKSEVIGDFTDIKAHSEIFFQSLCCLQYYASVLPKMSSSFRNISDAIWEYSQIPMDVFEYWKLSYVNYITFYNCLVSCLVSWE